MKEKKEKWIRKNKKKKFWTQKKKGFLRPFPRSKKDLSLMFPHFWENLNPEELIDWINELEEYFEYEDIWDPNRVKFVKAKLKGHVKIRW